MRNKGHFQEDLEDLDVAIKYNRKSINNIRYADDTLVLANDETDAQHSTY